MRQVPPRQPGQEDDAELQPLRAVEERAPLRDAGEVAQDRAEGLEPLARLLRELGDLRVRDDRVDELERQDVAVAVALPPLLVLCAVGEEEEVTPAEPIGGAEQQAREREGVARIGEYAAPCEKIEGHGARPENAHGGQLERA